MVRVWENKNPENRLVGEDGEDGAIMAWHGMAWTADGKAETFRRRAREVTGKATSATADAHLELPTTTRGRVETKQRLLLLLLLLLLQCRVQRSAQRTTTRR